MPDYTHLRRVATNAAEVMLEELQRDANAFLSSGPTRPELLAYACEIEEIQTIIGYHVDELAMLRRRVICEVTTQLDFA
jgi:hypothetical protein